MDCTNHPGTSATAICTRCDKMICDACRQERNGKACKLASADVSG